MKKKLLYRFENNNAVYLKENGHIQLTIAGRSISKPIENWITDDTTYTNRVLINEINSLKEKLDEYEKL